MNTSRGSKWPTFLTPILLIAASELCFLVWIWLAMSTMDYGPDSRFWGLQTAGWFILGAPFTVGTGGLISLLLALLARKTHVLVGWLCLLAAALLGISHAYTNALPAARLSSALHLEVPETTTILRLREFDSYNDGITTLALFTASEELADQIVARNNLVRKESFVNGFPSDAQIVGLPGKVDAFVNDQMVCYFHEQTGLLYFEYCRG